MSGYGWMRVAACADYDPEVWFPDANDTAGIETAAAICRTCPVRAECLEHALRLNLDHGVFAGTTRDQRRHLRHLRGIKLAGGPMVLRPHGTAAAYRRHYRRGERPCEVCADAEQLRCSLYAAARAAASSAAVPATGG